LTSEGGPAIAALQALTCTRTTTTLETVDAITTTVTQCPGSDTGRSELRNFAAQTEAVCIEASFVAPIVTTSTRCPNGHRSSGSGANLTCTLASSDSALVCTNGTAVVQDLDLGAICISLLAPSPQAVMCSAGVLSADRSTCTVPSQVDDEVLGVQVERSVAPVFAG